MDRTRGIRLASLLLGLLIAGPARADVRHIPPYVEWVGAPPRAVAGAPITGAIRICSSRPGEVTDVRLEGDGWSGRVLEPRPAWALTAGRTEPVRVEITPTDPERPLVVRFAVDGVARTATLDLSPARLAALRQPGRLVRPTGPAPPRAPAPPGRLAHSPGPRDRGRDLGAAPAISPTGATGAANAREIVVSGQIAFQRPDRVTVGADGMHGPRAGRELAPGSSARCDHHG